MCRPGTLSCRPRRQPLGRSRDTYHHENKNTCKWIHCSKSTNPNTLNSNKIERLIKIISNSKFSSPNYASNYIFGGRYLPPWQISPRYTRAQAQGFHHIKTLSVLIRPGIMGLSSAPGLANTLCREKRIPRAKRTCVVLAKYLAQSVQIFS